MVARPPPPCQAFDKPVCHASGSLPENCRISQVPMKPLHPPVSTARLAPAPRSTTPVEPVCLTNAAFPVLSTTLKHRGPRQCVNFRAQSRGSVLAVYASCRRYLRLRKTRLRLVVSLCRPRLRGVGFLRMVSPIVYLRYDSPFMGFAWRDRDVTLKPWNGRVAQVAVNQRLAPPQIRTCRTTASGSSKNGFATCRSERCEALTEGSKSWSGPRIAPRSCRDLPSSVDVAICTRFGASVDRPG